jgi:hypothetical protein
VFHEEKWLQERLRFAENDERKKFFEKCDQELRAAANGDHGLPGGYLTTLCPVAWKTLEAALRMEYFTGDSR